MGVKFEVETKGRGWLDDPSSRRNIRSTCVARSLASGSSAKANLLLATSTPGVINLNDYVVQPPTLITSKKSTTRAETALNVLCKKVQDK